MFTVPVEYKKFFDSVKRKCKYYGVNFVLSPSKTVISPDDIHNECSGYFDESIKSLVVACGKPTEEWIQILVHESSHMDQWVSDSRWYDWGVTCEKMWAYLDGTLMLNKTQLNKVIDQMIELELDCEKRSIVKIKEWGLPISTEKYIKKANTYLYSYRAMADYKAFPTGIYYDEQVVRYAPKVFQKDYQIIPDKLRVEINRFYEQLNRKNVA